jgi:hypothetical protein
MATLNITNLGLAPVPSTVQEVTIWYKLASDADVPGNYSLVSSTALVLPNGVLSPAVAIPGLTDGESYTIKVKNNCKEGYFTTDFTAGVAPVYVWKAGATECEKEGGLGVNKNITSMSSPLNSWYDASTNRLYVADQDDANGNVMWANPASVTNYADFTHSAAVLDAALYNNAFDPQFRRIYFVGADTGGLLVYDIDSDSTSVVAFGTNGAFRRTTLLITSDLIYCNDGSDSIVAINRNDLTIASTTLVSAIPSNTRFTNYALLRVGSSMYVIGSNNSVPTIGVYNLDFTTNITNITLTGAATWTGGTYYQNGFYDAESDRLYVGDTGSSKRFVIDPGTNTVLNIQTITNKNGKSNIEMSWTVNPITNELYALHAGKDTPSDGSPVVRTYVENRNTYSYANMFKDQLYRQMSIIDGTGQVAVANPGITAWVGTGGWNTDGTVKILSLTVSGDLTGRRLVLTLLKYNTATDPDTPTGDVKPNLVDDPDYEPPIDPSDCVVTYTTSCPADVITSMDGTTEVYEFTVPNSVRKNPAIAKVRIWAYDETASATSGSAIVVDYPLSSNYFTGQFAGLATGGGQVWSIQIEYLDSSNVVLNTCNP